MALSGGYDSEESGTVSDGSCFDDLFEIEKKRVYI